MSQAILLQFGADPFNSRYEDTAGRLAFSMSLASADPNLVIRLTRESTWSQTLRGVMGPDKSYYYFGPQTSPGYVMYGNNRVSIPFHYLCRQHRAGSTSRYFTAQSGRDYKWRISPERMECWLGRSLLAVWELSHPDEEHDARIIIRDHALPLVTEILTTLILNRMYQELNW